MCGRLYKLDEDYSQSNDISRDYPQKLEELKQKFDSEARANHVYPIGAGVGAASQSPMRVSERRRTEWHFNTEVTRLPEFCAPNLRARNNR